MVKTLRRRKHTQKQKQKRRQTQTRAMRGGNNNNNNNNNNYNNKEAKALKEEPILLRQALLEAIEREDIDLLQIFVEQPTYLAILKEGLECLENKGKIF